MCIRDRGNNVLSDGTAETRKNKEEIYLGQLGLAMNFHWFLREEEQSLCQWFRAVTHRA